jgi:protocatechuate 3,4-dioxygenase beta subunit
MSLQVMCTVHPELFQVLYAAKFLDARYAPEHARLVTRCSAIQGENMDNDDLPIGRVLDRREALKLIAASGAVILVGCQRGTSSSAQAATSAAASGARQAQTASNALPGCVVRPEMTEGPYFVDNQLNRSDIRSDPTSGAIKAGAPLVLAFNVSKVSGAQCTPLSGAIVDVWHCDAEGIYSGVTDTGVGFNTVGQKFLRGYQVTDAKGVARFTTIYPGWYPGRTVHIHFKIRTPASSSGKLYDFTSQVFFDEALNDKVLAQAPYNSKGRRNTMNASDGIFRRSGGDQLVLNVKQADRGYTSAFDIGLDLS